MILAVLYFLATLDATLIGHHAAIGKNPLINKNDYWRKSYVRGFVAGQLSLAIIATVTGLVFAFSNHRAELLDDCIASGRNMLLPFVAYAGLVVSALILYPTRFRILANVFVLGPFTLLRPFVLTAGVVAGIWARPRVEVVIILAVAWMVTMTLKPLLRRYPPKWS